MILRVGPYLYRVRRVSGYIEHEGQQCLGLCNNDTHELLVSDVTGELQQVQVLCHEYMEAWLYHFGPGLGDGERKEATCDLFGLAMTQFVLDYTHQIRQELGMLPPPDALPSDAPSPVPDIACENDRAAERQAAGRSPAVQTEPASDSLTAPALDIAAWAADCLVRSHYHPPAAPEEEAGWVVCVIEPARRDHQVSADS